MREISNIDFMVQGWGHLQGSGSDTVLRAKARGQVFHFSESRLCKSSAAPIGATLGIVGSAHAIATAPAGQRWIIGLRKPETVESNDENYPT